MKTFPFHIIIAVIFLIFSFMSSYNKIYTGCNSNVPIISTYKLHCKTCTYNGLTMAKAMPLEKKKSESGALTSFANKNWNFGLHLRVNDVIEFIFDDVIIIKP